MEYLNFLDFGVLTC